MRTQTLPGVLAALCAAALSATAPVDAFAAPQKGGPSAKVKRAAASGVQAAPLAPAQTPSPNAAPAAAAPGQLPPRVVFGGAALPVPRPDAVPYRDPVDGQLCIAPEALAPLGVVYIVDEKMGKVMLTTTAGEREVTVALRTPPEGGPSSGVFIPAVEVITALGGKCQWDAKTATLYARSVLTGVEMLGGQLRVKATLPILPTVTRDGARRIIVDVPGAEVGAVPRFPQLNAPNIAQVRTGQFNDDTARVVLEMKEPTGYLVLGGKPETVVVLNPVPESALPAAPTAPRVAAATPKKRKPAAGGKPTKAAPTVVQSVTFKTISDERVQLVVTAGRTPYAQVSQNRGRLTLNLLNAALSPKAASALDGVKHPFLRAARFVTQGGAIQMVLDLTRVVNFGVTPGKTGTVVLDLRMPRNAGGRLAGKLVVVDAGHGDHDRGARGANGTFEKNVNLAISLKLADALRDAGANVIMTRASDTFLKVNDRPRLANQAGADFFLSVHANDPGNGNRSINGSWVYYHGNDANCRTLAQCIAYRFEQIGGIASRGPRSDYSIYKGSGFGVLRNSRMVGVLIETGFMTSPKDVRYLNDPDYQRKMAQAIALGLRDYIEGNPDYDARNNNPAVGNDIAPVAAVEAAPEAMPVGAVLSPMPPMNESGAPPAASPLP